MRQYIESSQLLNLDHMFCFNVLCRNVLRLLSQRKLLEIFLCSYIIVELCSSVLKTELSNKKMYFNFIYCDFWNVYVSRNLATSHIRFSCADVYRSVTWIYMYKKFVIYSILVFYHTLINIMCKIIPQSNRCYCSILELNLKRTRDL